MTDFENRVLDNLETLTKTTSATETNVTVLRGENKEQFGLIRETTKQVNINMTEIQGIKNHRNGRGWLGRVLIRMFLGSV